MVIHTRATQKDTSNIKKVGCVAKIAYNWGKNIVQMTNM